MDKKEREILKALVEHPRGELSPADFINGIARGDERSVRNLQSKGYVNTAPHPHRDLNGNYYDVPFYYATDKGLVEFEPWHKKIRFLFRGDLRTVIIALITALGITLITIFIEKMVK